MKTAIIVFPGSNSEEETLRAVNEAGGAGRLVWWFEGPQALRGFDAFILPGGFAYEDRIRAGAVAARDPIVAAVIDAATHGAPTLGICNGAQVLVETGLVPGTGPVGRPQAALAPNAAGHFIDTYAEMVLSAPPERCIFTRHLEPGARVPAWASHGEGRYAFRDDQTRRAVQEQQLLVFRYAGENFNGAELNCAALTNPAGNALAIMPHPERVGWRYQQPQRAKLDVRGDREAYLRPYGGNRLFALFAQVFAR
ncbi:MAG: phosphoribosylformylglycinamidine synthase I [bacterium]|nr:phosphoribosylformylglycinamidine synthase I [bacterium]